MGEVYLIVNLTRGEYLHVTGSPPQAGLTGIKLSDLAHHAPAMYRFLELVRTDWAGDRVILAGDSGSHAEIYARAQAEFRPVPATPAPEEDLFPLLIGREGEEAST